MTEERKREGHERDVSLEWEAETKPAREGGGEWWRGGGCDAFTEEALSGWHSPPLPRLSAQTRTAPEEGVEKMQKGEKKKESFKCCAASECH